MTEVSAYIEDKLEPRVEDKFNELLSKEEAEFSRREAILAAAIRMMERMEDREGRLDRFLRNIEQYIADKVVAEKTEPQPSIEIWRQNSVS